jgi:DNA-binding response OmpR family regulator
VHVLVATDADWVLADVRAALEEPGTTFVVCRNGRAVTAAVKDRTPDLAILDLQVGSMGGMAITMGLRLDESSGLLPHVPVLMLLDRRADLFLAQRSGAEGWLIKPLDALRLRRAVRAITGGEPYTEGLPLEPLPNAALVDPSATSSAASIATEGQPEESPSGEPAATG